jgi:hypothetical protein
MGVLCYARYYIIPSRASATLPEEENPPPPHLLFGVWCAAPTQIYFSLITITKSHNEVQPTRLLCISFDWRTRLRVHMYSNILIRRARKKFIRRWMEPDKYSEMNSNLDCLTSVTSEAGGPRLGIHRVRALCCVISISRRTHIGVLVAGVPPTESKEIFFVARPD